MSARGFSVSAELSIGATRRDWVAEAGFWSALLTTIAIIVFDISLPAGFIGVDLTVLALAASFAIAPPFVALMVSLHCRATPQHRVWTGIGVAYAVVYATLIIFNYMLQLTVVRHNPEGYAWLSMALTGDSAFWVFELFGYGFMCLAAAFATPAMLGMRFEKTLITLFAINIVSSLIGIGVYMATSDPAHPVILFGLGLWGVLFAAGTALLAWQFRAERTGG